MKLFYSQVSPYARKSIMMAKAIGIDTLDLVAQSPTEKEKFRQWNPLGKIPFLIDDKTVLMDSTLMCEYLNTRYAKPKGQCYYKPEGVHYFDMQKQHYLANGIMDASINIVLETRRKDSEQSEKWISIWRQAVDESLKQLQVGYLGTPTELNIATFANIAMLEYLDLRMGELDWRASYPALETWHQSFKQVNWVSSTKPS